MSHLSGKLETFGLRQVLVLVAEAETTGELQVTSQTIGGRIFIDSGVVAYATTRAGADSLAELDALLESYDGDSVAGARPAIQEQLTEVLHELTQLEAGTFAFVELADSSRSFDVGVTFTVEDLLGLVDERIEDWRRIHEVIPSTDVALSLSSDLPTEHREVTLDSDSWSILSAVGGGASISEVASKLDTSEFLAGRRLAELVTQGLMAVSGETPLRADSASQDPASQPYSSTAYSRLASLESSPEVEEDKWATRLPGLAEDTSDIKLAELREDAAIRPPRPERVRPDSRPTDPTSEPSTPRVEPKEKPVSFSKKDLTPEERDEMIRNIGKGIYPSD